MDLMINSRERSPEYRQFTSPNNIKYMVEVITENVKQEFKSYKFDLSRENFMRIVNNIYEERRNHPEVMTQEVINFLSTSISCRLREIEFNTSLDPWIQTEPEKHGLSTGADISSKIRPSKYDRNIFNITW